MRLRFGGGPAVRVVDNPAARTPTALNLGIAESRHEIIVRVDGHGELTGGYIKKAVERWTRPVRPMSAALWTRGGPPRSKRP